MKGSLSTAERLEKPSGIVLSLGMTHVLRKFRNMCVHMHAYLHREREVGFSLVLGLFGVLLSLFSKRQ